MGHEERFPPLSLSVGCGLRKETIARETVGIEILEPSFRIGLISSYSSNKERLSTLADALRRAGLPE